MAEHGLTWIIGKTEHSLLQRARTASSSSCSTKRAACAATPPCAARSAVGRFDALLHMHASARANLVSLLVRAPLRIGFDRARARDQQWLFTNRQTARAAASGT